MPLLRSNMCFYSYCFKQVCGIRRGLQSMHTHNYTDVQIKMQACMIFLPICVVVAKSVSIIDSVSCSLFLCSFFISRRVQFGVTAGWCATSICHLVGSRHQALDVMVLKIHMNSTQKPRQSALKCSIHAQKEEP